MNIKKDYLFFWLDELEFTLWDIKKDVYISDTSTQEKPLWNLDDDNSNFWEINFASFDWTYSNIKPKGYEKWLMFQTVIDWKSIPCFWLLKGRHNKWINNPSKDKVVFYSSFFVLEYLNKLPFKLSEFYENYFTSETQLYRLDVALDVPYKIPDLKNKIFPKVNFFSQIGRDTKHPEFSQTYYINNPQNDKNRKYIFRIYDKIKDTFVKKKWFLYPHLKNNPDVRRIELELRPEECKRLPEQNISNILNNNDKIIQKVFTKFFNRFTEKQLAYKDIELTPYKNKQYNLQDLFLEKWHIPTDYMLRVHWYIRNVYEATGYYGLFQVILWVEKKQKYELNNKYTPPYQYEQLKKNWYKNITFHNNDKIFKGYDLLENLIKYLIKEWLRPSILWKIIKQYFSKKIKLCSK